MEIKTEVEQLAEENRKKRLGRKGASQTLREEEKEACVTFDLAMQFKLEEECRMQ